MFRILFILSVLLGTLNGCKQNPGVANRQELAVTKEHDSIKVHRIVLPNDSGVVFLKLENGKAKEKIRKEPDQTIIVEFDSEDSTHLKAEITCADSLANMRFSHIILPDKTTDGPFGKEIKYTIKQRGKHKLVIHESTMAGDPWAGVFTLKVKLTED